MSDVVDLTSSPEDDRATSRGRKRGREENGHDAEHQDEDNGPAAAAAAGAASSSSSSPQAKRRRVIAATSLERSGGAKTTGESSDDSDVVCLDDSSSEDERKPAARKRRDRSNSSSGRRSAGSDEAIDLTKSTSPMPNAGDSNIARLAASVAASVARRRPVGLPVAARPAAARPAAAAGPSPFATQATAYLDSVRGDLDHDKKREHFADARRPEQILRTELSNLWEQLRSITDRRSEEYRVCRLQIDEVEAQLHQARKNAAEDIYNRNNSAERMGRVGADGRLTVDYHGLYVRDAIDAYETMVVPVLPVQTRVAIITGKGLHSKGGRSALRDGLMEHIRRSAQYQEKKIECRVCPKNEGRLLVDWIGEA